MLNQTERTLVEALRNSQTIEIRIPGLELKISNKRFSHDAAIALQTFFNTARK